MVRRSALKAVTAGLAGAVLTNPLDVLRNECFKREQPVGEALRGLYRDEGLTFLHRCVSSSGLGMCMDGMCLMHESRNAGTSSGDGLV